MTGHHEIKVFAFALPQNESSWHLPEGYKPFSASIESNRVLVVCRKWHREEKEYGFKALAPAETLPPLPLGVDTAGEMVAG